MKYCQASAIILKFSYYQWMEAAMEPSLSLSLFPHVHSIYTKLLLITLN